MKSFILLILLSTHLMAQQTFQFGMNDVSILFPLPVTDLNENPLTLNFPTQNGVLIPDNYFLRLPVLAFRPNAEIKPQMKVVGLRVDPCFNEQMGPIKCEKQIRLVWQPLEIVENTVSTIDASMHSFYKLTDAEFEILVNELKSITEAYPDRAKNQTYLQINPILKKEGLNGPYFKKLTQIIERFTGESKLTRITFMQLAGGENVWIFGGFDIENQQMKKIQIPRINSTIQEFRNGAFPRPFWFAGGMFPQPKQDDNLNILIKDSRKLAPENELEIIAATKAAFQFENPKLHNPGTVDCVSCHVAQPAKSWAIKQYPWFNLDQQLASDIYDNPDNDLRNGSPMQIHTNIVRAFGYFMNRPFVAQRTINETSEVVSSMNSFLTLKEIK